MKVKKKKPKKKKSSTLTLIKGGSKPAQPKYQSELAKELNKMADQIDQYVINVLRM